MVAGLSDQSTPQLADQPFCRWRLRDFVQLVEQHAARLHPG